MTKRNLIHRMWGVWLVSNTEESFGEYLYNTTGIFVENSRTMENHADCYFYLLRNIDKKYGIEE